jgi:hypothetical protein
MFLLDVLKGGDRGTLNTAILCQHDHLLERFKSYRLPDLLEEALEPASFSYTPTAITTTTGRSYLVVATGVARVRSISSPNFFSRLQT